MGGKDLFALLPAATRKSPAGWLDDLVRG